MSQNLLQWADGIIKEAATGGELVKKLIDLISLAGRDSEQAQQATRFLINRTGKQLESALASDKNMLNRKPSSAGEFWLSPRQQAAAKAYINRMTRISRYAPQDPPIYSDVFKSFGGKHLIESNGRYIHGENPQKAQTLVEGLKDIKKSRPWVQAEEAKKKQQIDDIMEYFK